MDASGRSLRKGRRRDGHRGSPLHARRLPRHLWRVAQRKLKALDVAARLDDLRIPAGNRLERLKGTRSCQHSMRINDQYRVIFRWENGHAYDVGIEDYH